MTDPWFLTRGTGCALLLLFTLNLVLGTIVSARSEPLCRERLESLPTLHVSRVLLHELHRAVSTMTVLVLIGHAILPMIGHDAPAAWFQAIVPWAFAERVPLVWAALSVNALLLGAGAAIFRKFVPGWLWPWIHRLGYLSWFFALAHAWTTGSDMETGWGFAVWWSCVFAGTASLLYRTASTLGLLDRQIVNGAVVVPNQSRGHHDEMKPPNHSVLPELDDVPKPR